jgi:hypothetical protein
VRPRFDAAASAQRRWRAGTVARRASEVLRTEGPRTLWFRVLGETVYRRLIVMERPFDKDVPRVQAAGVELAILRPEQLEEYRELRPDAGAEVARTTRAIASPR